MVSGPEARCCASKKVALKWAAQRSESARRVSRQGRTDRGVRVAANGGSFQGSFALARLGVYLLMTVVGCAAAERSRERDRRPCVV